MTIIVRAETDLFRLAKIYPDIILVNPVNCMGVMGAGLALEFSERFPNMMEGYKKACQSKELVMGKLHIYKENNDNTIVINFPTKNHFMDVSRVEDIELGLKALREFIKDYPFYQTILPMMGCGLGLLDYQTVYPYMVKHLDDLPNIVHVCMLPSKMKRPLRYIGVVGSRDFDDYDFIEWGIKETLLDWNLDLQHFDALVSGGAAGVDTCAEKIGKLNGLKTVVVRADWKKYKQSAGMLRNVVIGDSVTHLIAFPSKTSIGTYHTIKLIQDYNKREDKPYEKKLAIIQV